MTAATAADPPPDRPGAGSGARLGRSAVRVSALGVGTAPLAGLPDGAARTVAVLAAAADAGVGYVDTAPLYGVGAAERYVGGALAALPADAARPVLSTKVGRLVLDDGDTSCRFDYSRDGVLASLEASLRRLRVDRVDIVLIHDPDDHVEWALSAAYPTLHELRAQGVVGAIGVGMVQTAVPTRFVRETDIDVVLLAGRYTLLDRSGAAEFLPACVERGVSVVIGGVFNSGVLADPAAGSYEYRSPPTAIRARVAELATACERYGVPLRAAAVQFPARHPAVAAVLVGVRTAAELADDVALASLPIPTELWAEIG